MKLQTATTIRDNGEVVEKTTFPPNGSTHDLQRGITNLMHRLVMADGRVTLDELGYLHINTLTYEKQTGNLNLKVYFDERFVTRTVENEVNGSRTLVYVDELNIFNNYLFVGDMRQAITHETILAPKTNAIADEINRPSLRLKEDSSKVVETRAVALHCSLPITMAAMLDVSVFDSEFKVICNTVGKGGKNGIKSIVTTSNTEEVPVEVTVTHSANALCYDPNEATPYLLDLMKNAACAEQNRDKLKQSVKKSAKKNKDKQGRSKNSGFNKYS